MLCCAATLVVLLLSRVLSLRLTGGSSSTCGVMVLAAGDADDLVLRCASEMTGASPAACRLPLSGAVDGLTTCFSGAGETMLFCLCGA